MDADSFFDAAESEAPRSGEYFVLVIYDVSNTKRRSKLSDLLEGYGVRVQRSAFECYLSKSQIAEVVRKALPFIDVEKDSLRVYRMNRNDAMEAHGASAETREKLFVVV